MTQGRLPPADVFASRRQNSTASFAAACGLRGPLRFIAENTESGQTQTFDVVEPFVLIGQAPGCHLRLLHPDVSFRHAYCQVLQGRLYVHDLDTEEGTIWGAGLQREGALTPESRLQIGPFILRLSRAPAFTCSLQPTADDWRPENEPLENVRLWFENATSRTSQSALRPLRRQITILGRSNRCHLKLSNSSVSKTHCAIVRTDSGYWVVDLLGRNGTMLNGQSVRFAAIGPDDCLSAGRFRMKIRELVRVDDSTPPEPSEQPEAADDTSPSHAIVDGSAPLVVRSPDLDDIPLDQQLARSQQSLAKYASQLPQSAPADGTRGTSDALILAMMEQFSHLQQQLLTHTQQQMSMLTEMFASLHKAQNEAVMDQLRRIQEITSELNDLRAQTAVAPAAAPQAESEAVPPLTAFPAGEPPGFSRSATGEPNPQPIEPSDAPHVVAPVSEAAREVDTESVPSKESGTSEPALDARSKGDDSDVVPVEFAETDAESAQRDSATQDAVPDADAHSADEPSADESRAPTTPRKTVSKGRDDRHAHARLTMRIGELERERKSHWKKLMELVGGGQDD